MEWPEGDFEHKIAASGEMETTIGRMEILGVICGLRYIDWISQEKQIDPKDIFVDMVVDSMFVYKAAIGLNQRKKNRDLWKEFDTFGFLFGGLSIEHRPRNTLFGMEEADRVAGEMRKALEAGNNPKLDKMIQNKGYAVLDLHVTV